MPERLDDKTRAALRSYLADVRTLPNESAKTHRFATLIGELFPGSSAVKEFAAGVEKLIRIDTAAGQKRGRIDSYYGNAVIEFENSLRATGSEAELCDPSHKPRMRRTVVSLWINQAHLLCGEDFTSIALRCKFRSRKARMSDSRVIARLILRM